MSVFPVCLHCSQNKTKKKKKKHFTFDNFGHQIHGVSPHTKQFSTTPNECPTIQLNSNTVYLKILSDPETKQNPVGPSQVQKPFCVPHFLFVRKGFRSSHSGNRMGGISAAPGCRFNPPHCGLKDLGIAAAVA